MILCKHCRVRIELIECADGQDRWLHVVDTGVPSMPKSMYEHCRMPPPVAEPY